MVSIMWSAAALSVGISIGEGDGMIRSGNWYVYTEHLTSFKNRLKCFKCFPGSALKKGLEIGVT